MRLRLYSDLHLEHGPFAAPEIDCDLVVLAGDIHTGLRGIQWAQQCFPSTPVLYVPGNHEYYGKAIPRLTEKLRERAGDTEVQVLDRDRVEIGGATFLGATLWTDFALFGDESGAMLAAQLAMNDYKRIRVSPKYGRMRPSFTRAQHWKSRRWLLEELDSGDGPVCIVTHHAPHAASIAECYKDDELSPAYASHLPPEILAHPRLSLWMHGHTHSAFDYTVSGTRVVCNPRGYAPDDVVDGFQPDLVIDWPVAGRTNLVGRR